MLHMSQERLADQLGLTFQQDPEIRKRHQPHQRQPGCRKSAYSRGSGPFFFEAAGQSFGGLTKEAATARRCLSHDFLGNADGHALVPGLHKDRRYASLRRSVVSLVEAIVSFRRFLTGAGAGTGSQHYPSRNEVVHEWRTAGGAFQRGVAS